MELSGKTVIVTGAGRGIGRALALEFARQGANVVCAARRTREIDAVAAAIAAEGGSALAVTTDVTDRQQVGDMVDQTLQRFGAVHVLFNNAGSFCCLGAVWELDPDQWWQDVTVNMLGTMLPTRAVLPHMIAQNEGIVINMLGGDRIPGGTGYSCSKVAVPRFTELLAKELEAEGSAVLSLAMGPGFVHTEMTDYQIKDPLGQKWLPSSKDAIDKGLDRPPEDCAVTTMELIRIACLQLNGQAFGAGQDMLEVASRCQT